MLKEAALYYCEQGYNCSQCLLKAAEAVYDVTISEDTLYACNGIYMGFGIGGMCSTIIAAIMVFGILFDYETSKRLRIIFLDEYKQIHGSLNCCDLIKNRNDGLSCEGVISEIADIVERLVDKEGYKKRLIKKEYNK